MSKQNTNKRKLITAINPSSPISEQFKTLRAGIHFSSVDHDYKSILVTSPEPESGKSTVSANLAICYAMQGNKTLLIDADMRKPTSHRTFGIHYNIGLSHLLTDSKMEMADVFHQTDIENLMVLTSGALVPNPNELLASKKMEQLIKDFSSKFDQIIIDTPPILASSDALVLTPYVEGAIVVLRSDKTLKERAKTAVKQLQKTHVPIIGTVLNRVKNNSNSYYYYQ
ncbi:CpsD/CapB family tyrosine-protein kinase [Listeria booriae]|uniref:non-specific protein-tyrosine kinase n=1 Tax=Listeria booriae TaxID=1552123 RepID=A0A7X0ZR51_9LIST|nr:CpsD/CapB family tyrosine-protein kinase [Listeria booriae]MBC1290901.1 CpsD/CapB family tyrosine-protein kinase [Listeria booriae]MBC1648686.1 CpsD/CapB family tyrosine-protein kinase [Listeria booriae]MBC1943562.1 CpsD/CapB family tyrosine-protein kinase [Listeria booriae]MBC2258733.1 CpsD/CapB family tyrosine-protein kinase [Listeria booriae]MBC2283807.1 CpsD/CapB family tyrosine-protein kinase [Listeria booriae]